jgi:hypothetical protein
MTISQTKKQNERKVEENILPLSERYKGSRAAIGLS